MDSNREDEQTRSRCLHLIEWKLLPFGSSDSHKGTIRRKALKLVIRDGGEPFLANKTGPLGHFWSTKTCPPGPLLDDKNGPSWLTGPLAGPVLFVKMVRCWTGFGVTGHWSCCMAAVWVHSDRLPFPGEGSPDTRPWQVDTGSNFKPWYVCMHVCLGVKLLSAEQ